MAAEMADSYQIAESLGVNFEAVTYEMSHCGFFA